MENPPGTEKMKARLLRIWRSLGCTEVGFFGFNPADIMSEITKGLNGGHNQDGVFIALFDLKKRPADPDKVISSHKTSMWDRLDVATRAAVKKKGITAKIMHDDNGWYIIATITPDSAGVADLV